MTDLIDLIDTLTRDHKRPVTRNGEFIWNRPERPLLHLLADARIEDIGSGNGTIQRHTRNPINTAASHLHGVITHRVKAWAREAHVPLTRSNINDPAQLLRSWYARVYRDQHLEPRTTVIQRWVQQIEDLCVDPPRRRTIEAPCPTCHARWTKLDNEHTESALEALERDPVNDSTAHCRSCGETWTGVAGIQYLYELIHRNEHTAHNIICASWRTDTPTLQLDQTLNLWSNSPSWHTSAQMLIPA